MGAFTSTTMALAWHWIDNKENGNEGETFWNKFGTLGRKKKAEEVREVVAEGNYAIDSPGMPKSAEMPPEEYQLEENEERSMIGPRSFDSPKLQSLITVLMDWINDQLAEYR